MLPINHRSPVISIYVPPSRSAGVPVAHPSPDKKATQVGIADFQRFG
jgi:hypothetical protein